MADDRESTSLPSLPDLHRRHPGLTEAVSHSFAEAAGVCFSRHHQPPATLQVHNGAARTPRQVHWQSPDERASRAWANRDDATRDGAYSVSLAAIEVEQGLVAVGRAETRTGADYLVAEPGSTEDYEEALRLEVSGTDAGDASAIRQRLRQKTQQVKDGGADTPALACVVGFAELQVAIEVIEGEDA